MPDRARIVSNALGLVGGMVGGYVGYSLFFWITRQGYYAMILPGALLGLGCGLLSRHVSVPRGVVCGVAGVVLGFFTEWKFQGKAGSSFTDFVAHAHTLGPVTLFMIAVGGLVAFWLGKDGGYGGPARSLEAGTQARR
jgi:hypothetical protein